jgi:hypothetical protein
MPRALLVALLLLGCSGSPVGSSGGWFAQLAEARDRWEDSGITQYQYTYFESCFCLPKVLQVTVVGGAITAIHDVEGDTAYVAPFPNLTVEGLFAEIEERLTREPATFDARYDASVGVPLQASFDPIANAVDDEWGFSVVEFTGAP